MDLFLLGHQSFASFDLENAVSKVISQTFGHLVEALPQMAQRKQTARFPSTFNTFKMRYLQIQAEEEVKNSCFNLDFVSLDK